MGNCCGLNQNKTYQIADKGKQNPELINANNIKEPLANLVHQKANIQQSQIIQQKNNKINTNSEKIEVSKQQKSQIDIQQLSIINLSKLPALKDNQIYGIEKNMAEQPQSKNNIINSQKNIQDSMKLSMKTKYVKKNQSCKNLQTNQNLNDKLKQQADQKGKILINPQLQSKIDIKLDFTQKEYQQIKAKPITLKDNNFLSIAEIKLKQTSSNFVDEQEDKQEIKSSIKGQNCGQNYMLSSRTSRLDPNSLLASLKKSVPSNLLSTSNTNSKFIRLEDSVISSRQQKQGNFINSIINIKIDDDQQSKIKQNNIRQKETLQQSVNKKEDDKRQEQHKEFIRKMTMSKLGKRQNSQQSEEEVHS